MKKINKSYSDYLLPYDEKTQYDISRGINNIIINSKEQLKEYIIEAFRDNSKKEYLHLGVIPNEVILRIKKEVTDIKKEECHQRLISKTT